MRINYSVGQNNFNFSNVRIINQRNAAQNNNNISENGSKAERRDSVTISAQGKKNSFLDNLMKQKTRIAEQKSALVSSTLENGGSLDNIKSQLENYEEQLKNIDAQIAEMMTSEMKQQAEKQEKQVDNKPKTEKEIENERLNNLTNLSVDLKHAETVRSVQVKIDGDARVLKSEIEMDKKYSGSSPSASEMIAKKEADLTGMEQTSLDLTSQITDKLSDISEKSDDNTGSQVIVSDKETSSKTNESESMSEFSPNDSEKTIHSKTLTQYLISE